MSTITFTCPHCQSQMNFPSAAVGQQGTCGGCQQIVTIQPDPTSALPNPVAKKKIIIIAASTAGAVGIVILCIIGGLLATFSLPGSGKADFDATGEEIFNALRERSTAKLQSHIFNNVVLNNMRAKIREGVPESLHSSYDQKNTRTNDLNRYSDRDMAEYSSYFIGFFNNEEKRYPLLKSQWENIEYIGIIGFLPPEIDGDRYRYIDKFKLNFDYSGSYDPDVIMEPSVYFKLDNEIYMFRVQEGMLEFDGKWYGLGDRSPRIQAVTSMPPVDDLDLLMYGGTEKVLVRLREELGL